MPKLQRKNANKELSALARLSDGDIDTSDIPEIKDWSGAIVGRFYKPGEQQNFPQPLNSDTLANDGLIALGDTNIQSTGATGIVEAPIREIVLSCIKGMPEAWSEFTRRFHRLIATVVMQTSRRWGVQSPEYLDDLVEEVYLHLCAEDYRLLRTYQEEYADSFFRYLKVVAANVVHDHFRSLASLKRGIELGEVLYEANASLAGKADSPTSSQETDVLFEEIDTILKTIASENERVIFWLYYRQGFTASEIASIPKVNLKVKGVEVLLHKLTRLIKSGLTKQNPKLHSSIESIRPQRRPKN